MRLENTYYVIMKTGNIEVDHETVYVSEDGFTNDIRQATKCSGRRAALTLKYELDCNKNNGYESYMQIIPVKITYEW